MSEKDQARASGPRVIVDDGEAQARPFATPHAPLVLETEETERIVRGLNEVAALSKVHPGQRRFSAC